MEVLLLSRYILLEGLRVLRSFNVNIYRERWKVTKMLKNSRVRRKERKKKERKGRDVNKQKNILYKQDKSYFKIVLNIAKINK